MNPLERLKLAYQAAVTGEILIYKGLLAEQNALRKIAENLLGPDLINNHDRSIGWDEVQESINLPSKPLL